MYSYQCEYCNGLVNFSGAKESERKRLIPKLG